MELVIGAIILVVIIGSLAIILDPDCPREILGYSCKSEGCDHSEKAKQDARKAMR